MKVALLGPTPPYRGGVVHMNYLLATYMGEELGDDFKAYAWKRLYPTLLLPKPIEQFQDKKSAENYVLDDVEAILDYNNPLSWIGLVRSLKKNKIERFITHWQQPVQFPVYLSLFLILRYFSKIEIMLVIHNAKQHEKSSIADKLTGIIVKFVDRIVVHSTKDFEHMSTLFPVDKITKLYLPLFEYREGDSFSKDEFRKSLELSKDDKVLLFFGFIRPYKGLDYLIEAMRTLKDIDPKYKLVIAGELFWKANGNKKESLFQQIKKLPYKIVASLTSVSSKVEEYNPFALVDKYELNDCVRIVDSFIPNEDVRKYFLISDVMVAPYLSASQSGPVQVAYNYDKPVLASNVGGLIDAVEDGVSGYKFEPASAESIVDSVQKFYSTEVDWTESVAKYKDKYSVLNYVKEVIK